MCTVVVTIYKSERFIEFAVLLHHLAYGSVLRRFGWLNGGDRL